MASRNAVRLSNFILCSGILFCIVVSAHYVLLYITFYPSDISVSNIFERNWYKYTIFLQICFVLLIFGLKLKTDFRVALSKWLLASFVALYGVNFFLHFSQLDTTQKDYLNELRDNGIDAYPTLGLGAFSVNGLETKEGNRILPLGGISNKVTAIPRLAEQVFTGNRFYHSDQYGFNNIENKAGELYSHDIDIVILGTCFEEFQGMTDPSKNNLGELLRKSGYKTINFSKTGSNFLYKLALLREYAVPLKPKATLFFYHTDDAQFTMEHMSESSSKVPNSKLPIILRYLNDDKFTQNLISKQDRLDRLMVEFLKRKKIERNVVPTMINFSNSNLRRILTLHSIRKKFKLRSPTNINVGPINPHFIKTLNKSRDLVSNWNGEFYLVRGLDLFSPYEVLSDYMKESNLTFNKIRKLATKLGIRVIDLHEELLSRHPKPLTLFEHGYIGGFPNDEYNKLAAELISKRLRKDGSL